ncbi:hypothetical protein CROQUDRAFT_109040 [Cronartium quercuum f. sp. fusiforme G11]|uniref:Uncharacterized protein n=1 Tax=Cronartium quercuum f. sp. fusiforme G11 TaxID=708437 RepID=A0A9P6NGB8_9BASI|nr:hypothetical protein CROQUDRAFT_109040 [Cronartium quercuum f. sp. fusiforme G11]
MAITEPIEIFFLMIRIVCALKNHEILFKQKKGLALTRKTEFSDQNLKLVKRENVISIVFNYQLGHAKLMLFSMDVKGAAKGVKKKPDAEKSLPIGLGRDPDRVPTFSTAEEAPRYSDELEKPDQEIEGHVTGVGTCLQTHALLVDMTRKTLHMASRASDERYTLGNRKTSVNACWQWAHQPSLRTSLQIVIVVAYHPLSSLFSSAQQLTLSVRLGSWSVQKEGRWRSMSLLGGSGMIRAANQLLQIVKPSLHSDPMAFIYPYAIDSSFKSHSRKEEKRNKKGSSPGSDRTLFVKVKKLEAWAGADEGQISQALTYLKPIHLRLHGISNSLRVFIHNSSHLWHILSIKNFPSQLAFDHELVSFRSKGPDEHPVFGYDRPPETNAAQAVDLLCFVGFA